MACFAADCSHRFLVDGCTPVRFPFSNPRKLQLWTALARRGDEQPNKNSRLCSCHFKDNEPATDPSVFDYNAKKLFKFPEIKGKRRKSTALNKKVAETAPTNCSTNSESSSTPKKLKIDTEESSSTMFQPLTHIDNFPVQERAELTLTGGIGHQERSTQTDAIPKYTPSPAFLEIQIEELQREVKILKSKLETATHRLTFESVIRSEKCVQHYTGFATSDLFQIFVKIFDDMPINYWAGWAVKKISQADQILFTLMRLRMDLSQFDLAKRFDISETTASNIFLTWIHVFHKVLADGLMTEIPSGTKNKACLPSSFSHFSNCRIVVDCTEIFAESPHSLTHQKRMWSNYKHKITLKGLVGVAPNGVATFISALYPGSTSDKDIVAHCRVMEQLKPGDTILADKGFLIYHILPAGVSVNLPPFLTTPQFTPSQVEGTKNVARARIHVERLINRIKCYKILNKIPRNLFFYSTKIWQVCAALTNFRLPLIKELENAYDEMDNECYDL